MHDAHHRTGTLETAPPLVFADECDLLRARLAAVARGEALLLQGGDGAETFEPVTEDGVRRKLTTLLQMAVVLTHASRLPVVKVGRMAGRFAPAGSSADTTGTAGPDRLERRYEAQAATLNLARSLAWGGFADLHQVHAWNREFVDASPSGDRYARLADEIGRTLAFLAACGADTRNLGTTEFFISHEGLLLDYERALTRPDHRTGHPYATSGHLLWAGEHIGRPDGAHISYLSGIRNPVAVKLGPGTTPDTVLRHLDVLDPDREPGRLTFVVRAGADRIRDVLPDLVEKAVADGARVGWVSDPMGAGRFDEVLEEVRGFVEVHRSLGTHPGGLHLELTGADTAHGPQLDHGQALDLAFLVAELYHPMH
ncbi:3-deoxy-7-phosphoheptulonate synthase class II [Streptomyces venezuelae]|uniref:Phospho-2-dehydro-3-deoxyheptonate aldolase n=1 Tax=Streptomyces venezuelae TaxID=54571 RepID=A0A5P2CYH6_STRVZ|nr:3-deoxy-7-phosphoheptulonate synthase [Streptomyces venezuelae]QES47513.1 3-deoxy-7-phosphoheptulonate synthase class II [Streptomyces venezuelae]